MKLIFRSLIPFKKEVFLLFVCVLCYTASNLALPYYLSQIINRSIPQEDFTSILWSGLFMFLFLSFGVFCQILQGYFAALATSGMTKNLRSDIFSKVQSLSQTEMDSFSTSSLITRTNNDVVQLQQFSNIFLRVLLLAPFMFFGGVIMIIYKNPSLAILLLGSLPLIIVFTFIMGRIAGPLSAQMQEKLDQINLIVREKLKGIRVTRAFNREKKEEDRFQKSNHDFMKYSIRLNTVMSLGMPIFVIILHLTMVAVLALSGFKTVQNVPVPVGDVIAIVQYVTQILMAVMMLSMVFVMYPRASVSASRIAEVLDCKISVLDYFPMTPFPSEKNLILQFKNVSFRFPHAQSMALEDISFSAKSGEVTAIIGSTGCGKSTLVDLIPRFYDSTKGCISINQQNIREISLASLRKHIGYVPQSSFLFQGTIKENIDFAANNLSDSILHSALKTAMAYDFILEKEDLSTTVSQAGLNFSGGQKQRLTIARAIAKNPRIYIFDDSFSALDYKTDAALRKSLKEITTDAIVLIVAQRVSTIKNADQIIVLEDGKIAGIGKHEELLKSCSVYQEIVSSQQSREEA